jgi:hypothetical protein
MTYPAYQDSDQIGSIHHAAICREIGERIRTDLDRKPASLSPRLIGLMKRLRNDRPWNSAEPGA